MRLRLLNRMGRRWRGWMGGMGAQRGTNRDSGSIGCKECLMEKRISWRNASLITSLLYITHQHPPLPTLPSPSSTYVAPPPPGYPSASTSLLCFLLHLSPPPISYLHLAPPSAPASHLHPVSQCSRKWKQRVSRINYFRAQSLTLPLLWYSVFA